MPAWQIPRARPHHYQFAHRFFKDMALHPKARLYANAAAGRIDDALRGIWDHVGGLLPEPDRLAPDGLHGELVTVGGAASLLVTFPEAVGITEAFFALITPVEPPEQRRYLTLEMAVNVMTGEPITILGSWDASGHRNHGPGPEPTRTAFLAALQRPLPPPQAGFRPPRPGR